MSPHRTATGRRPLVLAAGAAALAASASPPPFAGGPARAQGAAPTAQAQAPGFYRFKVGGLTVTTLHDGYLRRPAVDRSLVRNVEPAELQAALREGFLPTTHFDIPITVTFVETPRGLVAFDGGTGGQVTPTAAGLEATMRAAGLDPARVALVAVSHFHGDHISGLTTRDGAVVFPNAEVAVPEAEWAYWTDEAAAGRAPEGQRPTFANTRRRFAPYQARLRRYGDGTELLPGVRAHSAFGHTPGHSVFHVADGAEQLIVLADLTNHPVLNMRDPGWHFAGDQDPEAAAASRRRVLDRAAADRVRCTAYHWPFPANGYVAKEGAGYRFVPAEWSSGG
jgi:glyoxylase-like metal-dependent hydrolase (beta-lactamase superfamily II)